MNQQTIPPHILDRAVFLWCRALAAPVYRNERPGHETLPNLMAATLVEQKPRNNDAATLQRFGQALKYLLIHGTPLKNADGTTMLCADRYLNVDYGPCVTLRIAAERAGLEMEFPWKSGMHLNETGVGFHVGYGAEDLEHYQLPDGRWLVTTLRGSDISKVLQLVAAGAEGWTVEDAVPVVDAKEYP